MTRRFYDGWEEVVGGVPFRTVKGKKGPDDLRLEHWNGGWIPVPMVLGALMADFFYENEDHLYPAPAHGGRKYMGYIAQAAHFGYTVAEAGLQDDRLAKRLREQQEMTDGYRIRD